jgi:3-oxoacyl-[acyl-carrier-protein] synthase II
VTGSRVVVTGLGPVTPIGVGKEAFWAAAIAGRSGVGAITAFDASDLRATVAAEVRDYVPSAFFSSAELRGMGRFAQFAVLGARLALADADWSTPVGSPYRRGVILGSGLGGMLFQEQQIAAYLRRGSGALSPGGVPQIMPNGAGGHIALRYGCKGPNLTVATACSSGNNAIGLAYEAIKAGRVDVVVTGGTETLLTPITFAAFAALRVLATSPVPEGACRPFDRSRDGFVMGEAAGILVLESAEHALRRGARIYCEVAGYGATTDAHHMVIPAPEGEDAAQAIRLALQDAGERPERVEYVSAHGTATVAGDIAETRALKQVFGAHAARLPVSALKSMVGHALGASAAVEAIATALTVSTGWVHPTINYQTPDPACDLDYVPNQARRQDVGVAVSNAFAFGGNNAVLVFRRWAA